MTMRDMHMILGYTCLVVFGATLYSHIKDGCYFGYFPWVLLGLGIWNIWLTTKDSK